MRSVNVLRLLLVAALVAAPALAAPSAADDPPANLGKRIDNLTFTDAAGKTLALHDLKDKKAIVIVFLSFDCPVSTSYSGPLTDMVRDFGKHGVAFVGLTTAQDDTPAAVAKHAREYNLPFPVFRDDRLLAA